MKKHIFIIAALFGMLFVTTSCEDMLETESDRQIFDPALDQKTDSMFYTLGILKGVQQAIDQYVLVNEMRGDLTQVNQYTESDLRALANFSATVENKYDSAYVFYRIINNCNYFIAHRDTTLLTGSRNVSMPEYVQAQSIRAWAYLQLAKIYGSVPFYTEPVTSISQANAVREKKDIRGICDALAPELAKYAGYAVPTYGTEVNVGRVNSGSTKYVNTMLTMFPVDLVLGDLYLESGEYTQAAQSYFNYLRTRNLEARWYYCSPNFPASVRRTLPSDISYYYTNLTTYSRYSWEYIFSMNYPNDVITYVPMAVNRLNGETTDLPRLFGYDFYTTDVKVTEQGALTFVQGYDNIYILEREIDPSPAYLSLAASQDYYYVPESATTDAGNVKTLTALGDLRRYQTLSYVTKNDSSYYEMSKYEGANIPIYRGTTVYLRLAEAVNRMGYPDAAFAILKDGLNLQVSTDTTYIKPETQEMLRTTLPFFSPENIETFSYNHGIHSYGSGYTSGTFSPYQYDAIVGGKLLNISNQFGLSIAEPTQADYINAVEDLICDEYALEFAFEGNRFGDLCRLARHKNAAGTYGADFGSRWLASKLAFKNPVVNLADPQNWYLPFQ
ncbi:MAG: RagB/SusD family nutrient uptake outer membrane protein [Prevotella sp.]|nr:RagB/SusD family nutrient uptake outer membrane protein [Prevotella sp.]